MEHVTLETLNADLVHLLRLKSNPVGIKFVEKKADLDAIPKIAIPFRPMAFPAICWMACRGAIWSFDLKQRRKIPSFPGIFLLFSMLRKFRDTDGA